MLHTMIKPPGVAEDEGAGQLASDTVRMDFVSSAVHELRQPLTVLGGQVQFALRYLGADPARERTALECAIAQVDRMTQMIAELLDLARLVSNALSLDLVAFDLASMAAEAVERHQHGDTTRISLRRPHASAVPVRADPRRIAQILDNLLDNALKYSEPGTPIDVAVTTADGEAHVRVGDRGVGVPIAEMDRLFVPYYRTTRTRNVSGTGLGLHISRQLAARHGGRLWLESTSRDGSVFTLALPLGDG